MSTRPYPFRYHCYVAAFTRVRETLHACQGLLTNADHHLFPLESLSELQREQIRDSLLALLDSLAAELYTFQFRCIINPVPDAVEGLGLVLEHARQLFAGYRHTLARVQSASQRISFN
ncbi:MAG TPA: hypothetical protein VJG32_14105 [Anaerolineae bacterium]|nr:hypothetical protein [Anaerolineae bacterium]